jgi:hypothetical protein
MPVRRSDLARVCRKNPLHLYNYTTMLASRTFRTAILNAYCRHPSVDCRPLIILSPRPARSLSSRYTTVSTTSSGADLSELDDESFGIYSVILPPEPFVFGVSHIAQRPVPPHILRPPYVTPSSSAKPTSNSGDGRIQLGSSGERRLRSAARLARDVLEYAGTLVKVKTNRHCNPLTALTMR